jgi:surface protein
MNKIIATNDTIKQIVKDEIERLGNDADLNHIDTSSVTDMRELFAETDFNGDISKWDVSNVTNMSGMFIVAKLFNGDISQWNVSNVTDMNYMFAMATSFNCDISKWDVSRVSSEMGLSKMFMGAASFNQNISGWRLNPSVGTYEMFLGSPLEHWAKIKMEMYYE